MKSKSIPTNMQRRVLRWYDYSWSHGTIRGVNDVNSLGMMPDSLKVELAIHMNLTTLRKVCKCMQFYYSLQIVLVFL